MVTLLLWLCGVGSILAVLAGVRKSGEEAAEYKMWEKANEARQVRQQVVDGVGAVPDAAARERLRDWSTGG